MGELTYESQISTRSTARVVQALDTLVAELRGSGRLRFRGRRVTKEAVVNALCLMLADMGATEAEARIAPFMARLEALLAEDAPDASRPDQHGPARVEPTRVIGPEGGRKRKARGA